ncbi:hypothetical protein [Gordonia soli]|nr:hypothetical protein [Gordonia soli]
MTGLTPDLARLDASLTAPQCECQCKGGCKRDAARALRVHDCQDPLADERRHVVILMCKTCCATFVTRHRWHLISMRARGVQIGCIVCGLHYHQIEDFISEVTVL